MTVPYLYIIGNGFDCFHGLPTRYYDYGDYIKSHDCRFYSQLMDFYPVFKNKKDKGISVLWEDFEKGLKEIDLDLLWQSINNNIVQYGDSDWRDEDNHRAQYFVQTLVDNLTDSLMNHLINWICSIDVMKSIGRLRLEKRSIYLTFNYTKTLESYYSIPPKQVFHIHGTTDNPGSIITGHNLKLSPTVNDFDDIRQFECAKIIDNDYFQKMYKPTNDLITKNNLFFLSLTDVTDIVIIGHSMSEIDLPYFKKIQSVVKDDTVWRISFKDLKDKRKYYDERVQCLVDIGVRANNIVPFLMRDITIHCL
ncbi:MAG: bacteriophage abortive infection AbiH family protein [Bacteroidaceae bacterium]|nr:bacteriophage abortive infection AbiH family protein [Bacteroidaceae bacterium]